MWAKYHACVPTTGVRDAASGARPQPYFPFIPGSTAQGRVLACPLRDRPEGEGSLPFCHVPDVLRAPWAAEELPS